MSAFLLAANEAEDEPEGFGSAWLDDADAEDKTKRKDICCKLGEWGSCFL